MDQNIYDIIIFHYPCQDGLTSAWIATHYHVQQKKLLELYPIQHGTKLDLSRLKDKKILFCDYAPSLEVLDSIEKIVSSIKILDHHISAQLVLKDKEYAHFDMMKSGAMLTWLHFYPTTPIHKFIDMIQDRDLWTWKIDKSKEFTTGFSTVCSTIEQNDFEKLFKLFDELCVNDSMMYLYITLGDIINRSQLIKCHIIANEHYKKIDKYKQYNVVIVNCDYDIVSDLGNILSSKEGVDFAMLWNYNHYTEEYKVSLRSNNMVDTSIISKSYGGGGHKNASGFNTKINPLLLL